MNAIAVFVTVAQVSLICLPGAWSQDFPVDGHNGWPPSPRNEATIRQESPNIAFQQPHQGTGGVKSNSWQQALRGAKAGDTIVVPVGIHDNVCELQVPENITLQGQMATGIGHPVLACKTTRILTTAPGTSVTIKGLIFNGMSSAVSPTLEISKNSDDSLPDNAGHANIESHVFPEDEAFYGIKSYLNKLSSWSRKNVQPNDADNGAHKRTTAMHMSAISAEPYDGGCMLANGDLELHNVDFVACSSPYGRGGGLAVLPSSAGGVESVKFYNVSFTECSARQGGGAAVVAVQLTAHTLRLTGCSSSFNGIKQFASDYLPSSPNATASGGGLLFLGKALQLSGMVCSNCTALATFTGSPTSLCWQQELCGAAAVGACVAAYTYSSASITGSHFAGNVVSCLGQNCLALGGALWLTAPSSVQISDTQIFNSNTSSNGQFTSSWGGGIFINVANTVSLLGLHVQNCASACIGQHCVAEGGGVMLQLAVEVSVQNVQISNCFVSCEYNGCGSNGGGLFSSILKHGVIRNLKVRDCTSVCSKGACGSNGGGVNILNVYSVQFESCVFQSCTAICMNDGCFGNGAGLTMYKASGTTFSSCLMSQNQGYVLGTEGGFNGGGLDVGFSQGFTITDCSIVYNKVGAGLYANDQLRVPAIDWASSFQDFARKPRSATIILHGKDYMWSNDSSASGAGAFFRQGEGVVITDTDVKDNFLYGSGRNIEASGSGLAFFSSVQAELGSVNVVNNTAEGLNTLSTTEGAGIWTQASTSSIKLTNVQVLSNSIKCGPRSAECSGAGIFIIATKIVIESSWKNIVIANNSIAISPMDRLSKAADKVHSTESVTVSMGGGGLFCAGFNVKAVGKIVIFGAVLANNSIGGGIAAQSFGGGVSVSTGCILQSSDWRIERNTAIPGFGGGMANFGFVIMNGGVFKQNVAQGIGGAIYAGSTTNSTAFTTMNCKDVQFQKNTAELAGVMFVVGEVGVQVESSKPVFLPEGTQVIVSMRRASVPLQIAGLYCSAGKFLQQNSLVNAASLSVTTTIKTGQLPGGGLVSQGGVQSTSTLLQSAEIGCASCLPGRYSVTAVNSFDVKALDICHPCPFGGNCSVGGADVSPLQGYWGWIPEGQKEISKRLRFAACPPGQCCSGGADEANECLNYNSCPSGRQGILCGRCVPGYGMRLLTDKCAPDSGCNDLAWALPTFLVISSLFCLALFAKLPSVKGEEVVANQDISLQSGSTQNLQQSQPDASNIGHRTVGLGNEVCPPESSAHLCSTNSMQYSSSSSLQRAATEGQATVVSRNIATSRDAARSATAVFQILLFYLQVAGLVIPVHQWQELKGAAVASILVQTAVFASPQGQVKWDGVCVVRGLSAKGDLLLRLVCYGMVVIVMAIISTLWPRLREASKQMNARLSRGFEFGMRPQSLKAGTRGGLTIAAQCASDKTALIQNRAVPVGGTSAEIEMSLPTEASSLHDHSALYLGNCSHQSAQNLEIENPTRKRSSVRPYGSAWLKLGLTLFTGVLDTCIRALTCVDLPGIKGPDLRWWYDPDTVCFDAWQIAPFLIVCAVLPLPLALYARARNILETDRGSEMQTDKMSDFEYSAIQFYVRPFKPKYQHWLVVQLYQRVLMVAVARLIPSTVLQSIFVAFLAQAYFLFDAFCSPFADVSTQRLSRLCMFCLAVISTVEVRTGALRSAATSTDTGLDPPGAQLTTGLLWLTWLLYLFPVIIVICVWSRRLFHLYLSRAH